MEMDMISPDDALHPAVAWCSLMCLTLNGCRVENRRMIWHSNLAKVFGDMEFLGLNEHRTSTIKADAEPQLDQLDVQGRKTHRFFWFCFLGDFLFLALPKGLLGIISYFFHAS